MQTRDIAPLLDRMETLAEEIMTYKQQVCLLAFGVAIPELTISCSAGR